MTDYLRKISAVAPIRICDIGGWTDTWFSGTGCIFNIAVYPYVEVQILVSKKRDDNSITIHLENYNDTYSIQPDNIVYEKHPLIEAAIDIMDLPRTSAFEISIFSSAPPGASTGTSAAVSVALIGALSALTENRLTAHEVARMAHSVETDRLKLQCGIQDQICSAYGGINFIEMYQYPYASVSHVEIPNTVWWELESRLALVYIGTPHSSSEIHKKVIADLGEKAQDDYRLNGLRNLAKRARAALLSSDLKMLGGILDENTAIQRQLHRDLVCERFETIIDIAGHYGALGCKVNGAGGDGGSLTILSDGDMVTKRKMLAELEKRGFHSIPIYLARQGVRVWH